MCQLAKLLKFAQLKKNPDPLWPMPSNLDIFLLFLFFHQFLLTSLQLHPTTLCGNIRRKKSQTLIR